MSTNESTHASSPVSDPAAASDPNDALRRERDEMYDRLLRLTAEFDNYRKRTERERREWTEGAANDVIRDVLPVLDDIERALAAPVEPGPAAAAVTKYRTGFDLIRRQFLEILRRRGAEPIDSVGQIFDPAWHEAIAEEPAGDRPDGEITAEARRGYRIGTRLLRPAQVKVAKA
jgi:molecular chaperone GrpE